MNETEEYTPPKWSDRYVAELFLNREMRATPEECRHEAWVSLGRVCDAIARGNEAGARDQLVILAVLLKAYTRATCSDVIEEATLLSEISPDGGWRFQSRVERLCGTIGAGMASGSHGSKRLEIAAGFALLLAARGRWA